MKEILMHSQTNIGKIKSIKNKDFAPENEKEAAMKLAGLGSGRYASMTDLPESTQKALLNDFIERLDKIKSAVEQNGGKDIDVSIKDGEFVYTFFDSELSKTQVVL